jgi:hypothetical protein
MRLTVERRWPKATYTIGRLYVDGVYFCNTLEDTDRGLNKFMREDEIVQKKVYGETAIPKGTYVIDMDTVSPKYAAVKFFADVCEGKVPRLRNVPGFDCILIHTGNTALDTRGCLLVGLNTKVGQVTSSRDTFQKLYAKMKEAKDKGEAVTIEIK